MEENKQNRIKEIEERIKDLEAHSIMWARAGGRGGKMALQADAEIKELKLEKEDLINGTNKLPIYKFEKEIDRLKSLKEYANIFKKMTYNHKLKKLEEELKPLKK